MAKITLTHHYSGFSNVADDYSIGDNENMGNASSADYYLPKGYASEGWRIVDPTGCECAIVNHSSGRPQLISRAGKIKNQPVLLAALKQ